MPTVKNFSATIFISILGLLAFSPKAYSTSRTTKRNTRRRRESLEYKSERRSENNKAYTLSSSNNVKGLTLANYALPAKEKENDATTQQEHEHHNHYELEISYNDGKHFEFTGSVYFAKEMKIQATAETTGHHYAAVVVKELPFHNSHFGTFFGVGSTMAIKEVEHETHMPNDEVKVSEDKERDFAAVVQSGLAYSFDKHWSCGFTYSPGVNVTHGGFEHGLTLDLVFGF
ncbi:hypothetical protein FUAX_37640 [Fulvitalea axinellae]|uniref:Outer membrane protein beta-barrel domain-containing protein n=1 Tax=Fulvitalea axinellae TaxID=1182444 RepID=A0AAU9D0X2_9BACT|nr:hypothetical protein FUAX_37640 [Fulvitalea axinellae]